MSQKKKVMTSMVKGLTGRGSVRGEVGTERQASDSFTPFEAS